MKKEINSLKAQIASMYSFVQKNLDSVLDLFNEITVTDEGKALLKKIQEEKQAKLLQDIAEADEEQLNVEKEVKEE